MTRGATHLLLTGLSGAGKSTVGPALAAELRLPFIDLDRLIEEREGVSVSDIFRERGEAAFRAFERAALSGLSGCAPSVIALGGGTLTSEESHALVGELGKLIWLSVPPAVAAQRVHESEPRPLLGGDVRKRLGQLLRERTPHYARAATIVDAAPPVAAVVTAAISSLASPARVSVVRSHRGSYPVRIDHGGPTSLGTAIAAFAGDATVALIVDRHVLDMAELCAQAITDAGARVHVIAVDAGERLKRLDAIEALAIALEERGCDRSTLLVAVGGGSLTDAVGFLASAYRRGVRWLSVPTTLLGMVDSSLGGKTGVNLGNAKNLLGALYPPAAVLSSTFWLATLDEREVRSGLAEMLKVGATHDAEYFSALTRFDMRSFDPARDEVVDAIARAAEIKARVVSEDEFEDGVRKVLNFGHTFGHAFESAAELTGLRHGEAVALGMLAETEFAFGRGLADEDAIAAMLFALQSLGFDHDWRRFARNASGYLRNDKKRTAAQVRMPVVASVGKFEWVDAELADLERFLNTEGART